MMLLNYVYLKKKQRIKKKEMKLDKVKKEDCVQKKLKTFLKIFSIEIPNFFAYIFRELLPNISFWAMVRKRCMENILSKFSKLGPFFSLILPDKCSQISFWCRAEGWIKKINRYSSRANNRWTSEKHSTAPAGWTISPLPK